MDFIITGAEVANFTQFEAALADRVYDCRISRKARCRANNSAKKKSGECLIGSRKSEVRFPKLNDTKVIAMFTIYLSKLKLSTR